MRADRLGGLRPIAASTPTPSLLASVHTVLTQPLVLWFGAEAVVRNSSIHFLIVLRSKTSALKRRLNIARVAVTESFFNKSLPRMYDGQPTTAPYTLNGIPS
jgi:hypothetical protein